MKVIRMLRLAAIHEEVGNITGAGFGAQSSNLNYATDLDIKKQLIA